MTSPGPGTPTERQGAATRRGARRIVKHAAARCDTFDLVSSPLGRARQTMEIARRALGLDPATYRIDDRLREVTFGDWRRLRDRGDPRARAARGRGARGGHVGRRPPGGESYAEIGARLKSWCGDREDDDRGRPRWDRTGAWIELAGLDPSRSSAIAIPQDRVFLWADGAGHFVGASCQDALG